MTNTGEKPTKMLRRKTIDLQRDDLVSLRVYYQGRVSYTGGVYVTTKFSIFFHLSILLLFFFFVLLCPFLFLLWVTRGKNRISFCNPPQATERPSSREFTREFSLVPSRETLKETWLWNWNCTGDFQKFFTVFLFFFFENPVRKNSN